MTRLILILCMVLLTRTSIEAQPDSTVFLESDTPVILRLAGNGQPVTLFFEGETGQVVTIIAQAADPATLDLVLEWVDPSGERVAYNDDWAGERVGMTPPEGFTTLAASDSALLRLVLPTSGAYSARVNTFNGEGVGEASLTVRVEPELALALGVPQIIGLHRAEIAGFTVDLSAGQTVTITASDPRGRLDTVLELIDPDGQFVLSNDDHDSDAIMLNPFDAQLTYTAAASGLYRVQVRDFLGRAGIVNVIVADALPIGGS